MEQYQKSIVIKAPIEDVFHFHDDTRNLLKITPPSIHVEFETKGDPGLGQEIELRVRQFGFLRTSWRVRITEYVPPTFMVDEQVRGPFSYWKQIRRFESTSDGTVLTDEIHYRVPFGVLGRIANALLIRRQIITMFEYRQYRTKELLENRSASYR